MEAVDHATRMLIAVSHALDLSFNRGRGKIFGTWTEKLLGENSSVTSHFTNKQGKRLYSEKFENFLYSMPRKS